MEENISIYIVGGTGYVSGELIRLTLDHPHFSLKGVMSNSFAGETIADHFTHLKHKLTKDQKFLNFSSLKQAIANESKVTILSAAPHGSTANILEEIISLANNHDIDLKIVDTSADFRFSNLATYETLYGIKPLAHEIHQSFTCGIPEITKDFTSRIAHPGCFSTSILLAMVPLLLLNDHEDYFLVHSVTGSSGSGAAPKNNTHHPFRNENFYAYSALNHRHQFEIEDLVKHSFNREIQLDFLPHSGPFVRGIHSSISYRPKNKIDTMSIKKLFSDFYKDSCFVKILNIPPKIKDVAGTNYAEIFIEQQRGTIIVNCVIDNLIKGAAGGSIQWANKLNKFNESTGLLSASTGW